MPAKKRKKRRYYQTGKSNKKRDQQRKAMRPGPRKSRTGRKYTETRKNRSDMPGQLTGFSGSHTILKKGTILSLALIGYPIPSTLASNHVKVIKISKANNEVTVRAVQKKVSKRKKGKVITKNIKLSIPASFFKSKGYQI